MISPICIFEAGAISEAVGDQREDENNPLEEPVVTENLEMGCCGCADEPSSKVEPTVNVFLIHLLKEDSYIYQYSVLVKNNNDVTHPRGSIKCLGFSNTQLRLP